MTKADNFYWEFLKFKKHPKIFILPIAAFFFILIQLFIFSFSFTKNYDRWYAEGGIRNVFEYFFTRINFMIGTIFSFILIFIANTIYQSEYSFGTFIKLYYSNTSIHSILNIKLYLHLIYMSLTVVIAAIVIAIYSTSISIKYSDFDFYVTKANSTSWFQFVSLYLIKSINCCFLIRLTILNLKNKLLQYLVYAALILNNVLIFDSTPFNYFYSVQSSYFTILTVSLITATILCILIIYEKRIFKS
jgi:hypothetical protein